MSHGNTTKISLTPMAFSQDVAASLGAAVLESGPVSLAVTETASAIEAAMAPGPDYFDAGNRSLRLPAGTGRSCPGGPVPVAAAYILALKSCLL